MRSFIAFVAVLSLCHARPQRSVVAPGVTSVRSVEPHVIGGSNASPGDFPYQLSLQRLYTTWVHICGATLLSPRYGLTAASCVDGVSPGQLLVYAGLLDRSDTSAAEHVYIDGFTMHANYGIGNATKSDDIVILNFSPLVTIGGNVQVAILPTTNQNDYAGYTCGISGWGYTAPKINMSNILQKAFLPVLTTDQCVNAMTGVKGASIWDKHICVLDLNGNVGACDGDNGGPLTCQDDGTRVVGVSSWTVAGDDGFCLPTYPSVFTRVGAYLGWIVANTP